MGSCFSSPDQPSNAPEPVCLSTKNISDIPVQKPKDREHGRMAWRNLVSADGTNSSTKGLTCGIATCPPKGGSPGLSGHQALHSHSQAVVYIFQHGNGIININLLEYEVSEGSVVYVPGGAEHGIRNVDLLEDLTWYFCFATDRHTDVRYRYKNDDVYSGTVVQPYQRYGQQAT